jgi:hypothetical protein
MNSVIVLLHNKKKVGILWMLYTDSYWSIVIRHYLNQHLIMVALSNFRKYLMDLTKIRKSIQRRFVNVSTAAGSSNEYFDDEQVSAVALNNWTY